MNKNTTKKLKSITSMVLIASFIFGNTAWALPQQGKVVAGASTISKPDATTMHIHQGSNKSIINWHSYSIGAGEKVRYFQPNSQSISLNRVTGVDPSRIYGQLSGNGKIWVINPNGLLIGNNARIHVGSFLGSTLNIGNQAFMDGSYTFTRQGKSLSRIINHGNINTAKGGYAVLLSPSIENEGSITTPSGHAYLASGDDVTLNFTGNDLIGLSIDKATAQQALGIHNIGKISAKGGEVILTARASGNLMKTVINNTGIIEAQGIENHNGVIRLLGGMEHNAIKVGGTLDASAPQQGDGGFIDTSAAHVDIDPALHVTTQAANGKAGTWLIDPIDFIIAPSGGDISGAQLAAQLAGGNISIQTQLIGAGNGDIKVNSDIIWNANTTLTLTAHRNIDVIADITATGNTAGLVLAPTGTFNISNGAKITLSGATPSLSISGNNYTVINDVTALQNMQNNLAGFYALGSNIDALATNTWNGGLGFKPVGKDDIVSPFTGALNGLGHTVTDLFINRTGVSPNIALFGVLGSGGTVGNIGLVNVDITGSDTSSNTPNTGGLVGFNDNGGIISNAYTTGSVKGNFSGGLVGDNSGTISNSFSIADVHDIMLDSGSTIGGLVAGNYGSITNAYSVAAFEVYGGKFVGGLVGDGNGTITNSFSNSSTDSNDNNSVGGIQALTFGATIKNSYSGNSGSVVAVNNLGAVTITNSTGNLNSTQMKQQATFSGFDFTNIWGIDEGTSTPYFRWQRKSIATPASSTTPTPTTTAAAKPTPSQTAEAVRNRREVVNISTLHATATQKGFSKLMGKVFVMQMLNPGDREYAFGKMQKYLQNLTPAQARQVSLTHSLESGSSVSVQNLQSIQAFLNKNTDVKALKEQIDQTKWSYLKNMYKEDLARYNTVSENIAAMIQSKRLENSLARTFYDRLPLTGAQKLALKNASPETRKEVADALRKRGQNSQGDDVRKLTRQLANDLEKGTLVQTAQHMSNVEKAREAAYLKKLAQRYEQAGKDFDNAHTKEMQHSRTEAMTIGYNNLDWVKQHHVERVDDKLIARLDTTLQKMSGIYLKKGKISAEDQAKFNRLQADARNINAVLVDGYSDTASDRAAELAATIKTVKLVKSTSLTALKAGAFVASGGASAEAATFIQLGATGLSNFVDNYQKNGAASALLNSVVNTAVRQLPGGKRLKTQLGMSFAKSVAVGWKNTLIAIGNGKVKPEQANRYLYNQVKATFGKTVVKTFSGDMIKAGVKGNSFHSKAFKLALKKATGTFYKSMIKG